MGDVEDGFVPVHETGPEPEHLPCLLGGVPCDIEFPWVSPLAAELELAKESVAVEQSHPLIPVIGEDRHREG